MQAQDPTIQKNELKQILRDLKSHSELGTVRLRAEKLLKTVDPKVLSLAEQELLKEG